MCVCAGGWNLKKKKRSRVPSSARQHDLPRVVWPLGGSAQTHSCPAWPTGMSTRVRPGSFGFTDGSPVHRTVPSTTSAWETFPATSGSSQDGITETKFTPSNNNRRKQHSGPQDTRHQATSNPQEERNEQGDNHNHPGCCLEGFFRWRHRQGCPGETSELPGWKDSAESPGKLRQLASQGQRTREESAAQNLEVWGP